MIPLRTLAAAAAIFAACSSGSSTPAPPGDGGVASDSSGSHASSSSGSSSGSGSSGGSSGSPGGSSGSGSGSSSGSSGGENCQPGSGDFCLCYPGSSTFPANSTPCSPAALQDPGTCCAGTGWPGSGNCICSAFLCYVNQGGGRDCFYQDLGSNGAEVPTTSATGTACCTWGDSTSGYICSCYDDATACEGKTPVSSCTMGTLPPCSSDVTVGYTQVAACR